jgi:hypothetical protein
MSEELLVASVGSVADGSANLKCDYRSAVARDIRQEPQSPGAVLKCESGLCRRSAKRSPGSRDRRDTSGRPNLRIGCLWSRGCVHLQSDKYSERENGYCDDPDFLLWHRLSSFVFAMNAADLRITPSLRPLGILSPGHQRSILIWGEGPLSTKLLTAPKVDDFLFVESTAGSSIRKFD